MDALIISNFLLWGVLLCLVLVILALSRQIGVLYERVAPMGAPWTAARPAGLRSRWARCGQSQLVSPVCKLLPILKSVAGTEHAWLRIVLASDGEMPEHLAFYRQAGWSAFRICCPPSWA